MNHKQIIYFYLKSSFDVIFGILGLILISPLFLLIGISIKIDSKGPIFFKQKRIGMHQKHFYIYKFRTMRIDTPRNTPTHQMKNPDQWITRVGHFLRKTSLDEIPQMINIAKGEMSFIGPRPALWNQYDLMDEREKRNVHQVKPGVTGWAQVKGRDRLSIRDKAQLDGDYITLFGAFTDLRIVFLTVRAILTKDGIVEGGTGTLEKEADHND